jgi:hypothetical protein
MQAPINLPFKSGLGLKTNFTPSTISIPSPSQLTSHQATMSSPQLIPGHTISMIPVSLSGSGKARPTRQSLFSTTPLCMRTFGTDGSCEVDKSLVWGITTPKHLSKDKDDELQGQQSEGASLFEGTPGVPPSVSPTGAFMSALSQLPIEESLQYLIQSDPQPPSKSRLEEAPKVPILAPDLP